WFVDAITAERLWPDLAVAAALSLAIDMVLVIGVLALDAHYLETAAVASERAYVRLERIRQTGHVALGAPAARARFARPGLPCWGGIGPLAWRQLTTAIRSPRALIGVVLVFAITLMPIVLQGGDADAQNPGSNFAGGIMVLLSMIIPQM